MSSVNSRKDTTAADILNQLRQDLLRRKAGKTARENITPAYIIPANDSIAFTDSLDEDPPSALGLVFKCTNDAGAGVTPTSQRGIIEASIITEPNGAQIGAETTDGYGTGVHQPGICDTSELM